MAEIVVIGASVGGLGAAMLLAKDGHRVIVLERDPAPPAKAVDGWALAGPRKVPDQDDLPPSPASAT
jgi:glycine/D-amino acid oxidase-like deaminating enzyme